METDLRRFIDSLGGYRAAARRFGMGPTTLHTHLSRGTLPTKFYRSATALADEKSVPRPDPQLFSFQALLPEKPEHSGEERAA
ncbi:hypothetical protein [Pseudoroseicyclus aestuarii]|uniref:hypothetical protein n=1 Tax=Pseudoroseicyclus aestuarii TaxID=1795041 RepID=UPI000DA1E19D|nr:hypothetical protein [Pseudoroseicyclus aestuarii]